MFHWLKPKSNFLDVDLHSHLIPGIDDGVKSWDEALNILTTLHQIGYKKIITTPHIIHDYYPNTPEIIREGVTKLNKLVSEKGLDLTVEPGAEYFIDEHFIEAIDKGKELLTFGGGHILIETPFMNKPVFIDDVVFKLKAKGLKPILAHPERYTYLQQDHNLAKVWADSGLLMQINISALSGYYSKEAQKLAKVLIEAGQVHFLASDIHNLKHLAQLQKTIKTKLFQRCRQLPLLNSSL
ncbi:capsular biosynthesis protein [Reichenbachiella carrageenanivorans]|uniref:protein-tyrosine-phosphatase n=1 Tax=Reichenbachiella carrageenanivorans TaxID=2979869 RepID=A0ABY6D380_9BACT|nr:CpsB/CapC family capsule biosynthesis tyrosine phosphatase [Reichenbachiella carrageenanivorans]UXX80224.1 capsular biosynthesis protein [Reichenbachiella carrageenanivorans]